MNPLFAVRDCLRAAGLASAAEIAAQVQVPADVAADMLDHWVRRGLAERLDPQGGACRSGTCARCGLCGAGAATAVLYRWRTAADAAPRAAAARAAVMLHPVSPAASR
ncbi:FeoC-like transcriptional regulator [Thiomonas sp.]|uniref:FeoC-like transcriptional regulator n=1 Tax=Thiomonas sp. TaxID=2047785 RepID=UPI002623DABE|nr:FeoC-like transcriptional regulator [Thiomonas sp.]